jgi:hypothetical protein
MGTVLVGLADRLDGIDHAISRASDLLVAVPDLAQSAPPMPRSTA